MQQHRKRILQILYEERARGPLQALDSEDLANRMGITWGEIRHEVTYLEEKGYVALRDRRIGTRIFHALHLTAKGIDLLEGRVTDGAVHVGGDWVQITVGNGARNLALGKDTTQQQSVADDHALIERLDSTLHEFLDYLDDERIALKRQVAELLESLRKAGLFK